MATGGRVTVTGRSQAAVPGRTSARDVDHLAAGRFARRCPNPGDLRGGGRTYPTLAQVAE